MTNNQLQHHHLTLPETSAEGEACNGVYGRFPLQLAPAYDYDTLSAAE